MMMDIKYEIDFSGMQFNTGYVEPTLIINVQHEMKSESLFKIYIPEFALRICAFMVTQLKRHIQYICMYVCAFMYIGNIA